MGDSRPAISSAFLPEDYQHECPIRGHFHMLTPVRVRYQVGHRLQLDEAGNPKRALSATCPTQGYRWFLVGGREPCKHNRMGR
jgi:hypothetical protein